MENYESGKSIDNFAKKDQDNTKNYWINRKYKNLVAQINELEKDFKILTDTELRIHNFQLQTEYKEWLFFILTSKYNSFRKPTKCKKIWLIVLFIL